MKTTKFLKQVLLEVIGSVIAGSQTEEAQSAKDFALHLWKKGKCSIFISSEKLNAVGASFVNATMAANTPLEYRMTFAKRYLGSMICPAILSVAEDKESSGRQFLTALLISYEIGLRAQIIAKQMKMELGDDYAYGVLGIAAGAGKMIGLPEGLMTNAIGIAERYSTYTPLIEETGNDISDEDRISWGSMTGVNSAYLAEKGITGKPSLFSLQESESIIGDLGLHYLVEDLFQQQYFIGEQESKQTFFHLTERVIGKESSEQLWEIIQYIEEVKNMREFTSFVNRGLLQQVI